MLVVASGALTVVLTRQQYAELDRRVGALSDAVSPLLVREAARGARGRLAERVAGRAAGVLGTTYVARVRRDGSVVADLSAVGAPEDLPATSPGLATVATSAGDYRVSTTAAGRQGRLTVTTGLPVGPVRTRTTAIRRAVVAVGALAVLVAAGLGLLLAGPAVRPLRVLRERALAIGAGGLAGPVRLDDVHGAREVEDLAAALDRMQHDLAAGRDREARGLAAARDFASAAGHELRTPLAALATDLAVLRAHPSLDGADRVALLDSLTRAQRRLTSTLTALGQLARGDLADRSELEPIDLADLVAGAVADWRATHTALPVAVSVPPGALVVRGWPAGLRLALDNLLTNAAVHGAGHASVSLASAAGDVLLAVDDDGPGVPAAERLAVLGRFVRGRAPAGRPAGSGLGLALVAQQAELHGGSVRLLGSASGGLRVEVRLPAAAPGPAPPSAPAR